MLSITPAASTPGNARTRCRTRSKKLTHCSGVGNFFCETEAVMVSTP